MLIYNVFLDNGRTFEVEVSSRQQPESGVPVFTVVVSRPSASGREPLIRADGRPLEFVGTNETEAVKSACVALATIYNSKVRVSTLRGIIACEPAEAK